MSKQDRDPFLEGIMNHPHPTEPQGETPIFNEDALGKEIIRVWGEYGAHFEVYTMIRRALSECRKELAEWRKAKINETTLGERGEKS